MARAVLLALAFAGACTGSLDLGRPVAPPVSDRYDVVLPKLVRTELPSGLTVIASRNTDSGALRMAVAMRAGFDLDPPGKEGLARMAAETLELAARSPAHEARFGAIGATPTFEVTRSGVTIGIDVLQADAAAGVRALAQLVLDPVPVSTTLLGRARDARRAELALMLGSPDMLAALAFAKIFSPWKDRASSLGYGTEASLASITAADLEAWLEAARNAREIALVVAGPHDVTLAQTWAAAAFAELPQQQFRSYSGAAKVAPRDRRYVFIPRVGAEQTLIVVGGLRPRNTDDDAPAFDAALARLAAHIGYQLREQLQVSYGVGRELPGESDAFAVPIRVRADKTRRALTEIERALDAALQPPPSGWLARRQLIASVRLMDAAQHPDRLVRHASEVFLLGRALDSQERMLSAIRELDFDSVHGSAERHLPRSRVRIVVVGDPKLRAELGDDVEEWTPESLVSAASGP